MLSKEEKAKVMRYVRRNNLPDWLENSILEQINKQPMKPYPEYRQRTVRDKYRECYTELKIAEQIERLAAKLPGIGVHGIVVTIDKGNLYERFPKEVVDAAQDSVHMRHHEMEPCGLEWVQDKWESLWAVDEAETYGEKLDNLRAEQYWAMRLGGFVIGWEE